MTSGRRPARAAMRRGVGALCRGSDDDGRAAIDDSTALMRMPLRAVAAMAMCQAGVHADDGVTLFYASSEDDADLWFDDLIPLSAEYATPSSLVRYGKALVAGLEPWLELSLTVTFDPAVRAGEPPNGRASPRPLLRRLASRLLTEAVAALGPAIPFRVAPRVGAWLDWCGGGDAMAWLPSGTKTQLSARTIVGALGRPLRRWIGSEGKVFFAGQFEWPSAHQRLARFAARHP